MFYGHGMTVVIIALHFTAAVSSYAGWNFRVFSIETGE